MRIALITDGIWPYVLGGMQKHSYYLCKYLARQKIHVHLIHFNQSAYDIEKLEFFSAEEKAFIRQTLVPFPPAGKLPGHYLRNSRRYAKLVYETLKPEWQSFDFIYTKGFTGWQLLKEKRKGTPLPPVGIKFHGYEMFQKAPDLKTRLQHIFLLRRPARTLSLQADLVFSYGGKITDIIRSLGVPATRIAEIPSGVETEFIAGATAPVTRPLKFIFLGRYERRKGLEELFSALEQLQPKGCEFHIVGPIPENKKSALGIIRYHGEIRQREKVLSLLRSSDVLVCPSWSEGMPNVILEAMSQGERKHGLADQLARSAPAESGDRRNYFLPSQPDT
jgi:glycosyltransferase involved in cell wall biosynthesis